MPGDKEEKEIREKEKKIGGRRKWGRERTGIARANRRYCREYGSRKRQNSRRSASRF
jgi:hypothetical protein